LLISQIMTIYTTATLGGEQVWTHESRPDRCCSNGEGRMAVQAAPLRDRSGDASNVREALAPMMPKAGEGRGSISDVFGNVYAQCIQLMAGRAGEAMLLDGEPVAPADDLRQARELAILICSSGEAIETFIAHCDFAARDLLLPYGDVVMVLSTVLRIARTLDGPEIDKIISDLQTRKGLALEDVRRKRWQRVVENAAAFKPA
jgi:hypothetical protein